MAGCTMLSRLAPFGLSLGGPVGFVVVYRGMRILSSGVLLPRSARRCLAHDRRAATRRRDRPLSAPARKLQRAVVKSRVSRSLGMAGSGIARWLSSARRPAGCVRSMRSGFAWHQDLLRGGSFLCRGEAA